MLSMRADISFLFTTAQFFEICIYYTFSNNFVVEFLKATTLVETFGGKEAVTNMQYR